VSNQPGQQEIVGDDHIARSQGVGQLPEQRRLSGAFFLGPVTHVSTAPQDKEIIAIGRASGNGL